MRRSLFLIPILCLAAAACQKELPARLEVVQDVLSVESPAGRAQLEFTATRSWTATTDAPWCRVVPDSGNGSSLSSDLLILYDENSGHDERTCHVTISIGGMTKIVEFFQAHRQGLILDKAEFELSQDGQTLEIPAWTTVPVTVTIGQAESEWISLQHTKAMQNAGITLTIKENRSTSRSGEVHLLAGGMEYTVTIRQKPGSVRIDDKAFYNYCISHFDFDRDNLLTMDDAVQVTSMSIGDDVRSIAGLEQFSELRTLYIYRVPVSSLDLSVLPHLQRLSIAESPVRSLNLGEAKELVYLDLNGLEMDQLDLRGRAGLETLYLTRNPKLTGLSLSGCSSLREFAVTDCVFKSLDLRPCTGLEHVDVLQAYELQELRVSGLPHLGYLGIYETTLPDLDLSACPSLHTLNVRHSGLRELSCIRSGLAQIELTYNNSLSAIHIEDCGQLASLACANCEGLESVEILDCPQFYGLEFFQCRASSITLKRLDGLQSLQLNVNQCSQLILEDLPQCRQLHCGNNLLTQLDLSGCPALEYLFCSYNKLTGLDLGALGELQYLYCANNELQQLDMSRNPRLTEINFNTNHITELDLTANPYLTFVSGFNNPLKYLYLKSGSQPAVNYDPTVTTIVYR